MDTHSFDFLEFWPSTVIDLIFQHLSGREVLSATLVGRSWNDFLSNHSLTCFKDILVQPKFYDDLKYLVNSSRRYQHIKAVNISPIVNELLTIITKPGRKWLSIQIFRTQFESKAQVETILRTSSKTIDYLELNTLSIGASSGQESNQSDERQSFVFPQLKYLKISYHFLDEGERWLNRMFAATPQLEFAHLANACDETMRKLLVSSSRLKSLNLSGRFQDINFFKKLSEDLSSRLEDFEFNDILDSSRNDFNLAYFNEFFKSQSKTLKKFETDALLELDEFESAFKMPNLSTLNIKSFHYNRELIVENLERARFLAPPEASLRIFNVQFMDQNLLELLAIYASGLEELRVNELEATDASNPAWFPKIKIVQILFVNQNLDQQIRLKSDEERSRLEKLIIEGIIGLDVSNDFSQEVCELLDAGLIED